MDLDEAVTQLYGVHPDEFLAARRQLADTTRTAGDTGLAKAIASVRKPTAAAWAVNLLSRQRPDEVERLLTLATALHEAHERVDGPALKELGRDRTRLVDELVRASADAVREAGNTLSPTVANQVRETFVAALASPAAAEALATGGLTRALSYAGFGDVDLAEALASPARRPALRVISGGGQGGGAARKAGAEERSAEEPRDDRDDSDDSPDDSPQDSSTDGPEPDEPDPALLERLATATARSRETMSAATAAAAALDAATAALSEVDERITGLESDLAAAKAERERIKAERADAASRNKVTERTLRASLAELDEARAALPEED